MVTGVMLAGFALSIAGVAVCAWAGSLKEHPLANMAHDKVDRRAWRRGLLQGMCFSVAAGLLMPLVNLGLAFGDTFIEAAKSRGTHDAFASFAVYLPFFATTLVSTALYCGVLWKRNGT